MSFKEVVKSKKFWIFAIIIVTAGLIKVLSFLIYTKDEPKIIPEKVREEVRGGLKEAAEAIAIATPGLSERLVNSVYSPQNASATTIVDTSDWKTYKNEESGFELKYPEEWTEFKSTAGVIFSPSIDSLDQVFINIEASELSTIDWIDQYFSKANSEYEVLEKIRFNEIEFEKYKQVGGMEELHFITKRDGRIIDFLPSGRGYDYIEEMLKTYN